jgi:hypothetical protein
MKNTFQDLYAVPNPLFSEVNNGGGALKCSDHRRAKYNDVFTSVSDPDLH